MEEDFLTDSSPVTKGGLELKILSHRMNEMNALYLCELRDWSSTPLQQKVG